MYFGGLKHKLLSRLLPIPVRSRHSEYSVISCLDDDTARPTERLLDVALDAISAARSVDPSYVSARIAADQPQYVDVWPGEHYRLLAGFIRTLAPDLVVEIGTFTGLSALTMQQELATSNRLVTYDVISWDKIDHSCLRENDFNNVNFEQRIADLSDPKVFAEQRELISRAQFIFIDGPKDVHFERNFISNLELIEFEHDPILFFDDIRVWNMLEVWRSIDRPKLDLTSFGHWSGSGIVDWCGTAP